MSKNIVIFSDGTGQRGGALFDERRSNIYKLYRATRVGPDSPIDPSEQLAFYDPGIGTSSSALFGLWRQLYNFASQATGFGLTANIVDCYAALIRLWQPGDRIFLFGFSRGAYTVRSLGGVLANCGIPTRMKDGSPLRRDLATSKKIAGEAVRDVYQYCTSWRYDDANCWQRRALGLRSQRAEMFRREYGSDVDGEPNAMPYFVGVFDTVASVASKGSLLLLVGIIGALVLGLAGILAWGYPYFSTWLWGWVGSALETVFGALWLDTGSWISWMTFIIGVIAALIVLARLRINVKWISGKFPGTLNVTWGPQSQECAVRRL